MLPELLLDQNALQDHRRQRLAHEANFDFLRLGPAFFAKSDADADVGLAARGHEPTSAVPRGMSALALTADLTAAAWEVS
jgi:hypothetical protein